MTIGNQTIGTPGGGAFYSSKVWNGTDGKYLPGSKVLKDNAYSLDSHIRFSSAGAYGYRNLHMTQLSPPWNQNNKMLELQAKLVAEARAHRFNAGVALAESSKTATMVVDTLRKLGRAAISLKHGDVGGAARHLGTTKATSPRRGSAQLGVKDVADSWLELQYGWLPLLSDVHEASSAFADKADKAFSKTVKACVKSRTTQSDYVKGSFTKFASTERSMAYKVTVNEVMSQARSLGLQSPLTVAWELVPFSFAVDWFCPIGSYLDNLSNCPSLMGTSVLTTMTKFTSNTKSLGIYYGSDTRYTGIILRRTLGGGLNVPPPQVELGGFVDSSRRVWNAIALATQKFL